jgi:hypothetical protein
MHSHLRCLPLRGDCCSRREEQAGECFSVVGPEAGEEESSPDRRFSIELVRVLRTEKGVTLLTAAEYEQMTRKIEL